jgi:hypothetical protein
MLVTEGNGVNILAESAQGLAWGEKIKRSKRYLFIFQYTETCQGFVAIFSGNDDLLQPRKFYHCYFVTDQAGLL